MIINRATDLVANRSAAEVEVEKSQPSRSLTGVRCWVICLAFCWTGFGLDIPSVAQPTSTNASHLDLQKWIAQLGAPSFRERKKASRFLVEHGIDALPVLREYVNTDDPEIRERVRVAIRQIRDECKPGIIEQFATGSEIDSRVPIPGWTKLKEAVGDTPESRRLMAGILALEWDFLEKFEQEGCTAASLVEHCNAMSLRERGRLAGTGAFTLETISSILLAATQLSNEAHRQHGPSAQICNALGAYLSRNTQGSTRMVEEGPFRTLVGMFLAAPTHPNQFYQKMVIGAEYGFPETAILARQVLETPGTMPSQRHFAIVALGQFGDKSDIPSLESNLDDDALAFRNRTARNMTIQCQIRDAALFAVVNISDLSPADFGLPAPGKEFHLMEFSRKVGFPSDAERQKAFDRWEAEKSNININNSRQQLEENVADDPNKPN